MPGSTSPGCGRPPPSASGRVGPEDQRVRAVPDARTVRYYQSIGLVDRPEREGREAVYRWRHLLQVVAVKLTAGA